MYFVIEMMISRIVVLILFLSNCVFAQNYSVEKLEVINPNFTQDVYKFPILKGANRNLAEKINNYILENQGLVKFEDAKESIFEGVWRTREKEIPELNYFDYKLELLTDKLYSVTISAEFCAAYCEGYEMTYTFDLFSGNILTLDTFFTEQGKNELLNTLIAIKQSMIKSKISEFELLIRSDTISANDKEQYMAMIDLYKNCENNYDSLHFLRFIPSAKKLAILVDRCSMHYHRDLDELWQFVNEVELGQWKGRLSEYGKFMLLD